jgi:phytoene/squalene synthetase
LVEDIRKDLAESAKTLPLLPSDARRAVAAAQLLFTELNEKIGTTEASKLINTRISVSNFKKLLLLLKALLGVKL